MVIYSERNFRIVFARDAISGLYNKGLMEMEQIGVCVMDEEGIMKN